MRIDVYKCGTCKERKPYGRLIKNHFHCHDCKPLGAGRKFSKELLDRDDDYHKQLRVHMLGKD